ncbi:uncharacterized protein NPIL_370881 [Nephila pilipes]|uniref:Uncharacterized protein n=1 Tax=Nephila pilipes TaxID=299642 RepID=A0A8X6U836_NEPPI|nr:uncharacterized protein NPIL_370881 [Nephila pilipes]
MFAKLKTNPQTPQESNPITQYFEIGKQVASAGPELVWKIHEAIRKSDKRVEKVLNPSEAPQVSTKQP